MLGVILLVILQWTSQYPIIGGVEILLIALCNRNWRLLLCCWATWLLCRLYLPTFQDEGCLKCLTLPVFVTISAQGVPLRIEVGPRDLKAEQAVVVRRDNGDKVSVKCIHENLCLNNLPEFHRFNSF